MKNILIIGATSTIARACAAQWAKDGNRFFLTGRNPEKLQAVADDLSIRYNVSVKTYILDVNNNDDYGAMIESCFDLMNTIDITLIAHGTLPDQEKCNRDTAYARQQFSTNAVSTISLLTALTQRLENQGSGTIAVLSSVAGDRGRPSNYLYGAAKSAVTTFCEGLRGRLHEKNIHVLVIKPGIVDTAMTASLPTSSWLCAQPEKVARDIIKAVSHRRNTLYTPPFWHAIMMVIQCLPDSMIRKLKL